MTAVRTQRVHAGGFSLVELMVTLGVAAILSAIAIPNLRAYVQNVRRDSMIDSLVSSLRYARNQALTLDQTASVCAGTTAPTTAVCPAGTWSNGWEVVTQANTATTMNVLTTNALTSADAAPTLKALDGNLFIEFTPLGLLATTGANPMAGSNEVFVVCDSRGSAYARAVMVNATGYIQSSPTPGFQPNGSTALACP